MRPAATVAARTEADDAGVKRDLGEPWNADRRQRHERGQRPVADEESQGAAGGGENQAFDDHLRQHARARRAQARHGRPFRLRDPRRGRRRARRRWRRR
jgi:hypothetical protein